MNRPGRYRGRRTDRVSLDSVGTSTDVRTGKVGRIVSVERREGHRGRVPGGPSVGTVRERDRGYRLGRTSEQSKYRLSRNQGGGDR